MPGTTGQLLRDSFLKNGPRRPLEVLGMLGMIVGDGGLSRSPFASPHGMSRGRCRAMHIKYTAFTAVQNNKYIIHI